MNAIRTLISHLLTGAGVDSTTGPWYAFWSGFGADMGYLTAIVVFVYKHNCHADRCWRLQWKLHNDEFLCKKHYRERSSV